MDQGEFRRTDYQPAIKMLDEANSLAKDSINLYEMNNNDDRDRYQCTDCGYLYDHSITEKTSGVNLKQKDGGVIDAS